MSEFEELWRSADGDPALVEGAKPIIGTATNAYKAIERRALEIADVLGHIGEQERDVFASAVAVALMEERNDLLAEVAERLAIVADWYEAVGGAEADQMRRACLAARGLLVKMKIQQGDVGPLTTSKWPKKT